jgi:hypothetical protein
MAYGTINADVIQSSVTGVSLGAGDATRFKNRIINGNMVIDQRNGGASVSTATGAAAYITDRFKLDYSQTSKLTAQQNAGSVTPPTGFINYLGFTSSSAYSVVAGDYFLVSQAIEGLNVADLSFGTANAKTVTLSFQVYSSLTGTFGGALQNSAFNRSYPFSYTVSSANTWTQISITITGDTSGTWLTTNGIGINTIFSLGMGSTRSGTAGAWATGNYLAPTGSVSVVGTSGATFYITGVQLEVGSSATGFEYVDYTTQLAMCQRYYYTVKGTYGYSSVGAGIAISSTESRIGVQYPVQMRASPTTSISGTLYILISTSAGVTVTSISVNYGGEQGAMMGMGVASGLTAGDGSLLITNNSGSANSFNASAEL